MSRVQISPRLWRFAAATVLLALLAACDKEKDVEPPAELVDFKETLSVQRVWSASLGGGDEVMRGGLAPTAEGERVFVESRTVMEPNTAAAAVWTADCSTIS